MKAKIYNLIIWSINVTLLILGLFLYPINCILSLFKKKNNYISNNKELFSSNSRKLNKILKYNNSFSKEKGKALNLNDVNETMIFYNDKYLKETKTSDSVVITLPIIKISYKSLLNYFKQLKKITSSFENYCIQYSPILKRTIFYFLYFKKINNINNDELSNYKATININNYYDHELDKKNIINRALASNRFYTCYSKYVSDNFPWINVYSSAEEIKKKINFSKEINNFGYENIFNFKFLNNVKQKAKLNFPNIDKISKDKYDVAIIFPIYNNGKYLLNRSFKSCLFNNNFNKILFIFVDDGSKKETLDTINLIKKQYKNVISFSFNDGGSGSPSRPRNKGTKIAFEKDVDFLTFLDPDNYFYPLVIDEMLSREDKYKYDIFIHNISVHGREGASSVIETSFEYKVIKKNSIESNGIKLFDKLNMIALNMQQIFFNQKWYKKNYVYSYEDSIGEDNIYWYELILKKPSVFCDEKFMISYYNYNDFSITNNINLSFFKKALNGEYHMFEVIKNGNLLDKYINEVFFTKFWYGIISYDIKKNILKNSDLFEDYKNIFEDSLKEITCLKNKDQKRCIKKLKKYFYKI